jgi:hypothetical protein
MKSKPWQLSKWRKDRKEFLKGKACEWCGSEKEMVIHHPQAKYSLTDEQYESFDGTKALCKRCHFALHKGLVLCKVCKKNYHEPEKEKCWDCFKKSLPPKKAWEIEYHLYKHLWCGKTFKIKGKNWEIESIPSMCCIEHCEPNGCEIAVKHWDEDVETDQGVQFTNG